VMDMASPLLARTYGYLKKVTEGGDARHTEECNCTQSTVL
jgi:hypothetical protein